MLPAIEVANEFDHLRRILTLYPLQADVISIMPVDTGLINNTWKIELADGTACILQRINTSVFKNPDYIAGNLELIKKYLLVAAPDYLFVAPLLTATNARMVKDDVTGYFRLFPFVSGSHSINVVTRPQQAFEAARQFGLFTRLLSGFDAGQLKPALPHFHNLSLRYLHFQTALQQASRERTDKAAGMIEYLAGQKNIADIFTQIQTDAAFKKRVTHHDTKISNVLFNSKDEGVCVIDLDTVMEGYFISDVGDMMRTYLTPVNEEESDFSRIHIREEYFRAIVEGYFSQMKNELSSIEKQHFVYAGKFMVYMQAVRFLTDYLNNDCYYGARYEGHNLVRAGNQFCLLQRIIEKEDALNRIVDMYS